MRHSAAPGAAAPSRVTGVAELAPEGCYRGTVAESCAPHVEAAARVGPAVAGSDAGAARGMAGRCLAGECTQCLRSAMKQVRVWVSVRWITIEESAASQGQGTLML